MRTVATSEIESTWNVMAHGDEREGKWRWNWRMEWVSQYYSQYLGTWCIQHYYRWWATPQLPAVDWTEASRRFKWTRPFQRKTKSDFCACAIIFQMQSTLFRGVITAIFSILFRIGNLQSLGNQVVLIWIKMRHITNRTRRFNTTLQGITELSTKSNSRLFSQDIALICDKSVTTQNLAFLSYWYRKKRLQIHF